MPVDHDTNVNEYDEAEGMAYYLCSECGEPIVQFGKKDGSHLFDRKECGCEGGSPRHGWRMLQEGEVDLGSQNHNSK